MRLPALLALVLFVSTFSPQANSADSLSDYIAALGSEARMGQSALPSRTMGTDRWPSLDAQGLLKHSYAILHAASPEQRQQLYEALVAFVPRYVIPANISPIPNPGEYLAFTEVHVIYSEILDRASSLQRASWAEGDKELLDGVVRKLCSAPSTIDLYRRVLDHEIAAGRYPATAVSEARALRERLVQRNAWYLSEENLSTCRDLTRVRVAP